MYLVRICEIQFDDDGCTLLLVYSWKKIAGTAAGVCRHTSQTVTLFMHTLNLIVAYNSLSLSLALPRWLHCLCNHALSPSDEKLIAIHLYQKEPSLHCRHRLDCCVYTLLLRTHLKREDSLMLFILGVRTRLLFRQQWWYFLLSDNLLQCYLTDLFIRQHRSGEILALSFIEETVSKHLYYLSCPNSQKQKIVCIFYFITTLNSE